MRISFHPYTLRPGGAPWHSIPGPRSGALLRIEFEDGRTGYADLHPWPEFGQEPLGMQLATLAAGTPGRQAALAVRHARIDAEARHDGVSGFAGLPNVTSHALFTDWTGAPRHAFEACVAAGFHSIKLKVGRSPDAEAEALNALAGLPLGLRLDANASFTATAFREWIGRLRSEVRDAVEFIEDPCPYDARTWLQLARDTGLRLALDWQIPATTPPWPGAAVAVLKPSVQDVFELANTAVAAGLQLVVTHSLDHPLGRAIALWSAMQLRQRHGNAVLPGGLGGGGVAPLEHWLADEPLMQPVPQVPTGTGFGFDSLLAGTPWQSLRA